MKIKIQWIIGLIALLAAADGYGQKQPFTQYFLNMPAINPAFTGIEPFMDLKTSYKQRWNSFDNPNGSFFVSAHGALGKQSPSVYRHNALRVSNPKIYGRMSNNRDVRRKHGIGGMVMSQKIGAFSTLSAHFNYAYHLPLTSRLNLAMGGKLAYSRYEISFADLVVRDMANDLFFQELVNSSEGKDQRVTGDFGFTLYSDHFYIGLSSSHLISQPLRKGELLKMPPDKSFDMVMGSQFDLDPQFELYPGIRIRNSEYYDLSWEVNLRLRYNKLIYVGAVYENEVKAALLFGLTFAERYNINYSYDYFINDMREYSTGNHEFTLGMAVFNKYSREQKLW